MKISSPAFENTQPIPKKYTKISPPLVFKDVPDDALSLVLIVHDPDAPSGDYTHWVVWNIPPITTQIQEGELPSNAIQGQTDSNTTTWIGPAPPSGTHHYFFDLYALSEIPNLPAGSTREELEDTIVYNVIDHAELVGTYSA